MEYAYVILIAFAVMKTAESLHCWKCQSSDDGDCRDYFNVTKANIDASIRNSHDSQKPTREDCDSFLGFRITTEKSVCMKEVEIVNGRKHYTRQCKHIPVNLPVGECMKDDKGQQHQEQQNYKEEHFCQYCDTDFCNDADQLKTEKLWLIVASVISFLFLRY